MEIGDDLCSLKRFTINFIEALMVNGLKLTSLRCGELHSR